MFNSVYAVDPRSGTCVLLAGGGTGKGGFADGAAEQALFSLPVGMCLSQSADAKGVLVVRRDRRFAERAF